MSFLMGVGIEGLFCGLDVVWPLAGPLACAATGIHQTHVALTLPDALLLHTLQACVFMSQASVPPCDTDI